MWLLHMKGANHGLYYWDDFLILGPMSSQVCKDSLQAVLALHQYVSLSVAAHKTEGLVFTLVFLRRELDIHRLSLTRKGETTHGDLHTLTESPSRKEGETTYDHFTLDGFKRPLRAVLRSKTGTALSHLSSKSCPKSGVLGSVMDTSKKSRISRA